jgi:DNA repair photolyase
MIPSENTAAPAAAPAAPRTMAGKPVFNIPAKSVINFKSGFVHKLLCDGPTFSTGSACVYKCAFCYVPDMMEKSPHWAGTKGKPEAGIREQSGGAKFENVVIRRAGALKVLRDQLTTRGKPRFPDPDDKRVIYSSSLVDVAANLELVAETVEACKIILELTHWHIRLLSKSTFLPRVADGIPEEHAQRMIYGVSTGTLHDKLALAFEQGTPKPSMRIKSLHELQDRGLRTYGMLCPSLPIPDGGQNEYNEMCRQLAAAIRPEKCEHVWAECINVRGESMTRTRDALNAAGFPASALAIEDVSTDKQAWEEYSRRTFLGHASHIPDNKLRFLQYVTKETRPWWNQHKAAGAVLL